MTRDMHVTVRDADAGQALWAFLAGRFTYHDASGWRRLILEGRVTLNGTAADAERRITAGDQIRFDASGIPEPPVDDTVGVISDDPCMMVVNKPGNLPCHPGGRYFNHTLWAVLKKRHGLDHPVFVNRLDRETSGLVLVAKTRDAAAHLWQQFAGRRVEKRYVIFVEGLFPDRLETAGWLYPDHGSVIRKKRRFLPSATAPSQPEPGAEWAETVFERVARGAGFSVVAAFPRTGRLHQIRATVCSLGYPVVGDKVYGVDETLFLRFCADALTADDRTRLRLPRQALHADRLRVCHPGSGERTELLAPLTADMRGLLGADERSVPGLSFDGEAGYLLP